MQPPRIPVLLSGDQAVVYFVTICVEKRQRVLDNTATWNLIQSTLQRLDRWSYPAALAMPDHLHFFAAPCINRDESLSTMLMWFKRWFHESSPHKWRWQISGFDRLLRRDESVDEKWHYMRMNPVRANLVTSADDWPYQFTEFR